jgi:hypothetical protein
MAPTTEPTYRVLGGGIREDMIKILFRELRLVFIRDKLAVPGSGG